MAAVVSSCSTDDIERTSYSDGRVHQIEASVDDLVDADGTRTSLDLTDYSTTWASGDAIDIHGVEGVGAFDGNSESSRIRFEIIPESVKGQFAQFNDKAGFGLVNGYHYVGFYPALQSDCQYDAVPLNYDYTGVTIVPGGVEHIKDYDYLATKEALTPENGSCTLQFYHVGTLVKFRVVVPNAGTYDHVQLVSGDEPFVTSATVNIATGETTPVMTSPVIDFDITSKEYNALDIIDFYMMLYPKDYSDATISIYVGKNGESKAYYGTVKGKELIAGNKTSLSCVASSEGSMVQYVKGHEVVDLGLPSGTLWSAVNIGAKSKLEAGDYFAWGETVPYGSVDESNLTNYNYNLGYTGTKGFDNDYVKYFYYDYTYKYAEKVNTYSYRYNKYCLGDSYSVDNANDGLTTLLPEDDAATQIWGEDWHIPTYEEFSELVDNCDKLYTTINGTQTFIFTSKINGVSIYFPFGGYRTNEYTYTSNGGNCWTSTIGTDSRYACYFNYSMYKNQSRYLGMPVRPVYTPAP